MYVNLLPECMQANNFDQLCINYVNERFQHLFIERMLIEEKIWYEKDGLDVPFVPFFDNGDILRKVSQCILIMVFYHFFLNIITMNFLHFY